jgi:hypothetical protein
MTVVLIATRAITATRQEADEQRQAEPVHGILQERGGPENRRIHLDSGKPGLHVVQRSLEVLGDLQRAGAGELLHDQQEARILADDGIADQRLVVLFHLGNVTQEHGRSGVFDTDLGQVLRRSDGQHVLDAQALARRLDEPARAGGGRLKEAQRRHPDSVAGGLDDLFERDALVTQLRGGHFYLELLLALSPNGNVGDTGNADEPWLDLPPGQDRHLDPG